MCVCVYVQARIIIIIMHEGLMRVSGRKYSYTVTYSLFSQYLIIFLMVTQHQRIGEFSYGIGC